MGKIVTLKRNIAVWAATDEEAVKSQAAKEFGEYLMANNFIQISKKDTTKWGNPYVEYQFKLKAMFLTDEEKENDDGEGL